MKRRVAKKHEQRWFREWRRAIKRRQGWHNLAIIKVGVARAMAAIDGRTLDSGPKEQS